MAFFEHFWSENNAKHLPNGLNITVPGHTTFPNPQTQKVVQRPFGDRLEVFSPQKCSKQGHFAKKRHRQKTRGISKTIFLKNLMQIFGTSKVKENRKTR